MAQSSQIDSLQAGRALAALAVVVHHAALAARDFAGPVPAGAILEAGYLGVDFFFVLSGFIIYHSSQGKRLSDYAWARFRRVYLPYAPIGIGIALLYTVLPQLSAGERDWAWLPTLTLLPMQAETALAVAWTLKHEVLFYFVFAALYFTGWLGVGLAVWALGIVLAALGGFGSNVPLALINLEFLFGIGVAVAYRNGWGRPAWFLAAIPPLALWLFLGAERDYSALVGMAFAAVILPTIRLEAEGRLRVPSWLLFLGAASYAIYLVHGIAISIVGRILSGQHWSVVLILGMLGGVLAGLAYFWLVERRLLRASGARTIGERRPTSLAPKAANQP